MDPDWWRSFFDGDYLRLWSALTPADRTEQEVAGLWSLLQLAPGMSVLDAPCGYGRVARPLAERGARVLGVDQSTDLLAKAEADRGDLPTSHLRYLRHDLRDRLAEGGFDAAINIFTCLGYGSEEDDRRILSTLAHAVRPGGFVVVESNHRDAVAAVLSRSPTLSQRLGDGTLVVEEPRLDPLSGRVETAWHWSGPTGSGVKTASLRIYTVTELAELMTSVGLAVRSLHRGLSPDPFVLEGPDMGGRVGLVGVRER